VTAADDGSNITRARLPRLLELHNLTPAKVRAYSLTSFSQRHNRIRCRMASMQWVASTPMETRTAKARKRDRGRDRGQALPPGASKWNKIEHRLFSFISQNWRAKPLVSYKAVVQLIAATTTSTGLGRASRVGPVRDVLDEAPWQGGRFIVKANTRSSPRGPFPRTAAPQRRVRGRASRLGEGCAGFFNTRFPAAWIGPGGLKDRR
jgi:Rhodopirellula transposase DDE domain